MLTLFDAQFWHKLSELAAVYSTRALGALCLLVFGLWLARRITKLADRFLEQTHLDPTTVSFMIHLTRVALMALVVIVSLNIVGVPVTSVVAVLGTVGLAIALALKDSLNNVAAGISLLILRPFEVGDYIELGSSSGSVKSIGLFHTLLTTPDNRDIFVPNAKLLSETIVNYSANSTRRIDLNIEISYESNLLTAKNILQHLIDSDERILKDPEPLLKVGDLTDRAVNLVLRPWVNSEDYWDVRYDLMENIKLDFESHQIVIPYPQQQIHLPEQLLAKN